LDFVKQKQPFGTFNGHVGKPLRKTQGCPCQARTFWGLPSVEAQSDALKENEIGRRFFKLGN
jgi:hypothetical protein